MYSNELICNVLDYIDSNINKEITIDELSNIFYFNKTYIMKRFKKELGLSIHAYINSIRIYNSLTLFKIDNSILGIGLRNGFNSIEYFSETFKKVMSVSPMIYKKFVNNRFNITEEQENIIKDSVIRLQNIKELTLRYKNNRKPKDIPVKKIFLKYY